MTLLCTFAAEIRAWVGWGRDQVHIAVGFFSIEGKVGFVVQNSKLMYSVQCVVASITIFVST